jgi:hypothetical protein
MTLPLSAVGGGGRGSTSGDMEGPERSGGGVGRGADR